MYNSNLEWIGDIWQFFKINGHIQTRETGQNEHKQ